MRSAFAIRLRRDSLRLACRAEAHASVSSRVSDGWTTDMFVEAVYRDLIEAKK